LLTDDTYTHSRLHVKAPKRRGEGWKMEAVDFKERIEKKKKRE
jgi:hypothetical protein